MPSNPEPEEVLGDPIPRDEPFVVPASPEQTFDSVWLRSINIFVPNTSEQAPSEGSINIEMLPYDGENEKVLVTADNEGERVKLTKPLSSIFNLFSASLAIIDVIFPFELTCAKSRALRNSRLAIRGVPLDLRAISNAP